MAVRSPKKSRRRITVTADELKAALDQETKEPGQTTETRTEYRLAYDAREGGGLETFEIALSDPTALGEAEARLENASGPGRFNFRIQYRTVTESSWEDITDAN